MSTLEQIIEAVHELDEAQQVQVLEHIHQIKQAEAQTFTLDEWLKRAQASLDATRTQHGEAFRVDIQALLDEVREEPTDERLGRR